MPHLIPVTRHARKAWVSDLSSNIAFHGAGVALLSVQIADLEERCAVLRNRATQSQPRAGVFQLANRA